jgi:hypothetical protein
LKTFKTTAPKPNPILIEAFVGLLRSPVLNNLQRLRFSFSSLHISIEEQSLYEALVMAIANLPTLEHLYLHFFPLHLDWIQHFQKSPHLHSVRWKYYSFTPTKPVDKYEVRVLKEALRAVLGSRHHVVRVRLDCLDFGRNYEVPYDSKEEDRFEEEGGQYDPNSDGYDDDDGTW